MSSQSQQMRKEWAINDAKRDANYRTPDTIERFDDISYGPYPENVLDVYRRKDQAAVVEAGGKLPVIVSVHGGGWVYGDKELYQFYCMDLATRGFVVVNFTYRLSPESKYPAQMEDINQVIHWMAENADEYGMDMDRVFMVGDSAGAHMLGIYTCICTDPAYAAQYPFAPVEGFKPRAIALNCGAYRPLPIQPGDDDDPGTLQLMEDLLENAQDPAVRTLIDVTAHINPQFPPMYVMTAHGDQQVSHEQAYMLLRACEEKGVPYTHRHYGGANNVLYHVYHITIDDPNAIQCNDDECAFFLAQ